MRESRRRLARLEASAASAQDDWLPSRAELHAMIARALDDDHWMNCLFQLSPAASIAKVKNVPTNELVEHYCGLLATAAIENTMFEDKSYLVLQLRAMHPALEARCIDWRVLRPSRG